MRLHEPKTVISSFHRQCLFINMTNLSMKSRICLAIASISFTRQQGFVSTHTRRTEIQELPFDRAVSSHSSASKGISIELQRLPM
jgi:hypothetical protein